jgi:biotin transport system substrate-specific component
MPPLTETLRPQPALLPRSLAAQLGLVIGLTVLLVLSAKLQVPFWPVPMTLQTLAVLLFAGLFGARVAGAAFILYLIEGAVGLPVFAGSPERGIGITYMMGPTGGYLFGMLLASLLVGWLADRGLARRPVALGAAMLAAIALVYLYGATWLAGFVGVQRAVALGVVPFIAGDVVKVAIAATAVFALRGRA